MRDFKKYDIWQLSHELSLEIYRITNLFPKEEMYGITSQIRRAAELLLFQLISAKVVVETVMQNSISFSISH
ncbi:four helix bundle protein [Avrilella dinanensis]|uniref:four helix bundle protein n=1 Tax=Avrilella dinanensis TaxID=2008672 RepID=UPI0030C773E2